MALTDENGMVMPVTPMYGGNGGFGGGLFGGDLSIIVLFFLFMMMGGWGNGFGGGFGGGDLYPWMNNSQNINSGFRDQMLGTQIGGIQNSITSGFGDVATALCGGFAGVNASINGAQNAITQQMYQNTIADMERSFGVQTQLQNCCCENRANIADLKYTVATENCADRAALNDALRDVLTASNANTQKILDRLTTMQMSDKDNQIYALQSELQAARNQIDNASQTQALVNALKPYPVPAYTVGSPYASANGCGCTLS
jgi:hypothetical protein